MILVERIMAIGVGVGKIVIGVGVGRNVTTVGVGGGGVVGEGVMLGIGVTVGISAKSTCKRSSTNDSISVVLGPHAVSVMQIDISRATRQDFLKQS